MVPKKTKHLDKSSKIVDILTIFFGQQGSPNPETHIIIVFKVSALHDGTANTVRHANTVINDKKSTLASWDLIG